MMRTSFVLLVLAAVMGTISSALAPIGTKRTDAEILAEANGLIQVARRQAERLIRLEITVVLDRIFGYNEIVGVAGHDFDKVLRATRAWTAGSLSNFDLHASRLIRVVYQVLVSIRAQIGGSASIDASINRISREAATKLWQIVDETRVTVEREVNASSDKALARHQQAVLSATPWKYQAESDSQLSESTREIERLIGNGLGEVGKLIDSSMKQLNELRK